MPGTTLCGPRSREAAAESLRRTCEAAIRLLRTAEAINVVNVALARAVDAALDWERAQ
jgi:hypothetical protein